MKNIYDAIWVDAIVNMRKKPENEKDWKLYSMIFMTLLNGFNLSFILILLADIFKINVIWVKFTIFPLERLNDFARYAVQFAMPSIILNYFLIFYKDRYKGLIKKYPDKKGKLFAVYLIISPGIFIAYAIIYKCLY